MTEELPPGTALIKAIRAEKSPYYLWAGEVLDNAFDASATAVELHMTAKSLDAVDNGHGVLRKNDRAMVQISEHGAMPSTKLGRFGVGFKYKSIQHGQKVKIHSISADGRLRRDIDWEHMLKTGRWIYGEAFRTPVEAGTATGTYISIRDLITRPPKKADVDRTQNEIQRRYYPALEGGCRIKLNDEEIGSIAQPELRDIIETTLKFPGGRSAHLRAGMLVDPQASKLRQVDICIAYRVIVPESNFACDGYGGIRAMFVKIVLLGPWKVTKFKDGLAEDPYEEDLEAEAMEILKPLLEQCQSASMVLKTKHLEFILNEMLPDDQRMVRPMQKEKLGREGDKRGDKTEKEIDGSPTSTGLHKKKKPPRGIMIEFADHLHETHGFGRAQVGKSTTRIQLAADNPHIRILINHRDQQLAAIGLYSIAMLLFEGDLRSASPGLFDDPIGLRAWKLAGDRPIEEQAA